MLSEVSVDSWVEGMLFSEILNERVFNDLAGEENPNTRWSLNTYSNRDNRGSGGLQCMRIY